MIKILKSYNDSSTIHPHQDKLKKLRKVLEDFQHGKGKSLPLDSQRGRLFEADLHKVNDLMEEDKEILTKEEMLDMNTIFKTCGGKRKTNDQ